MKDRPLCMMCLILFFALSISILAGREKVVKELRPSPLEESVSEGAELLLEGKVYKREVRDSNQLLYLKDNSIQYQEQFLTESRILVYTSKDKDIHIGQRLAVKGEVSFPEPAHNPGNFDQKLYYQRQNIHAFLREKELMITDGAVLQPADCLFRFRQSWRDILIRETGEKNGKALTAVLLGEKSGITPELKELYQKNGIGHILAISGLHLSFIGLGLYRIVRRLTGSYLAGGAAGIFFLTLYLIMIGITVSAARAFVMFLFRVGADIRGRHYDSPTALSAAAVTALLWRPLSLYDGGFWLSFGAVLAVMIVSPLFAGYPFRSLWVSLCMNLTLLPVILYYFYEFPVYSVLLNLLVIPLMPALLCTAFLGSFFAAVLPGGLSLAGTVLLKISETVLWLYEKSCQAALHLPGASIVAGQPEIWQIAAYYGCVMAGLLFWKRLKDRKGMVKRGMLCLSAWIFLGSFLLLYRFGETGNLKITVLDVGQGDGIFLKGPSGGTYFIDGGSSDTASVGKYRIEPFLKSQGAASLDYVFVSHGDSDHINGMEEMIERQDTGVKIETLVLPVEAVWDEELKELAQKAEASGVRVAVMEPDKCLSEGKLKITCLQPGTENTWPDGNAASMILEVSFGEFDMLFTGDVEGEGEERLTDRLKKRNAGKRIEILKVAHHGSKNSSREAFLTEVNPLYAVISAGKNNRYGHPHAETVGRLNAQGCRIYSTAQGGAIEITVKDSRKTVELIFKIQYTHKRKNIGKKESVMTYEEVLKNARTCVGDICKACPVCNGRACGGKIPGPGAKGTGTVAIQNYDAWQKLCVNMDTICENKPVDLSFEAFGQKFKYPVFAAPIGAMKLHYGDKYDDLEYNDILVSACADAGIAAFTGDGTNPAVMEGATKAIRLADGKGIPTVKPWDVNTLAEKFALVRESGAFACAMDVDAAGLPFLKNLTPPAGSKSVDELKRIIAEAGVPFILKGIMTVKGALKAKEAGASAIVVSNHGGRVLDQCPPTAEVLAEISDAVGKDMKIFVDGGIRSGVDVFKALALGADAVLIGRPYVTAVYGGAKDGVNVLTEKLAAELSDTMAMCGAHSLSEITRDMVR